MRPTVSVVGSINLDLVTTVQRLPVGGQTVSATGFTQVPGGKGANQALAAARMGADVRMIGCVGNDGYAEPALALLRAGAVDLSGVRRVAAATGLAMITVDADGENTIVVVPGANASVEAGPLQAADAVLCQLEIPIGAVLGAAAACTGMFCLNVAPAAPVPIDLLRRTDLVIANRGEYAAVPGVDEARLVAVTDGPRGAVLLRHGVEVARATPQRVSTVDGTAAGDAFVGALVVGLVAGLSYERALARACVAGAITASRAGAQPALPTAAEVDA